jgi:hypothetical protein
MLLLVSCLAYSSTLKMESMFSETFVSLRTTRRYNAEGRTLPAIYLVTSIELVEIATGNVCGVAPYLDPLL